VAGQRVRGDDRLADVGSRQGGGRAPGGGLAEVRPCGGPLKGHYSRTCHLGRRRRGVSRANANLLAVQLLHSTLLVLAGAGYGAITQDEPAVVAEIKNFTG